MEPALLCLLKLFLSSYGYTAVSKYGVCFEMIVGPLRALSHPSHLYLPMHPVGSLIDLSALDVKNSQ